MSDFVPFEPRDGIVLSDHAGFEQRKPWSVRIPAAIEKAQLTYDIFKEQDDEATQWFGHALALAEALWEAEQRIEGEWGPWEDWPKSPALRAYTGKIESF